MTPLSPRTLLLAFALIALLVPVTSVTPATAQSTPRTIVLEAHDAGTEYWFTLQGQTQRNPTLTVNASETVTFKLINKGTVTHNLHIDPNGLAKKAPSGATLLSPNQTAEVTVTFPDEAKTLTYQCDPHAFTMKGTLQVQKAGAGAGDAKSPGFEVVALVAAVGVAGILLHRRK